MKDELTSEKRYGVQNRPIHYQYLCHSDLCFESIEQYKKNIGNLFYKTQPPRQISFHCQKWISFAAFVFYPLLTSFFVKYIIECN